MIKRLVTILLIVLFGISANLVSASSQLALTPEELQWLKEHNTIRLSGPQAFPPFQRVDQDNVFHGMAPDYVQYLAEMLGLNIEFAEKAPWPKILERVKNREIDVLSCAAETPERKGYLSFTLPHLSFPLVIIARKDAPFISDVKSLNGRTVALVKGSMTSSWIKEEVVDFVPLMVDTPLMALKEVSHGNADVTVENLAAGSYLIEKAGLANLKVAAPTSYDNYTLSIGIRSDWPELVSIFNKALAAIPPEKHDEIRQRWIAVRYEHGIRMIDVIKWVVGVSVVSFIALTIFYRWNRKLRFQIEERLKVEREKEKLIVDLTSALEEIKALRGIMPICTECKNIRDDSGYWTKIEDYISNHSEADFSHSICPDCAVKLYGKEDWFNEDDMSD